VLRREIWLSKNVFGLDAAADSSFTSAVVAIPETTPSVFIDIV
jgi:hypothetical protein